MSKAGVFIIFSVGTILGGACGVLGTRLYFKRKYEELSEIEIEDYKKAKNNEVKKQVEKLIKAEGELKETVIKDLIDKYTRPKESINKEDAKPKVNKYTEYGSYYVKGESRKLDISDKVLDDFSDMDPGAPPEGDDSDSEVIDSLDTLNYEKRAAYSKGIEIISDNEWQENSNYDKKEYFYYMDDEVLTDENDEILEGGFSDVVGTDWINEAREGKDVYVRNNYTGIDYLINTIDGEYYND